MRAGSGASAAFVSESIASSFEAPPFECWRDVLRVHGMLNFRSKLSDREVAQRHGQLTEFRQGKQNLLRGDRFAEKTM